MSHREEGRAWFSLLLGFPALLGWLAYGIVWLIEPRLAIDIEPIRAAAYAVGSYYVVLILFTVGPLMLVGM